MKGPPFRRGAGLSNLQRTGELEKVLTCLGGIAQKHAESLWVRELQEVIEAWGFRTTRPYLINE